MSNKRRRRQSPPADDRERWWRIISLAAVQSLAREALVIVLREIWRGGPW